ncbi:Uncharacterised protein [Bordetella ansorpii]|uniref:Phage protein n=1 Tax=Bordetella ansorpii TaxID=288768 RepID=A0A157RND2_9BORD|nr:hypothetical protein [Bordetella ansorpii]SAI58949.1 Uncharacterised protein [Bordetella ansorpii]
MASYTQQDLERINKAIASSQLEVQYRDKRVKYRDMDELIKARTVIQNDLDSAAGKRRQPFVRLRSAGKGVR